MDHSTIFLICIQGLSKDSPTSFTTIHNFYYPCYFTRINLSKEGIMHSFLYALICFCRVKNYYFKKFPFGSTYAFIDFHHWVKNLRVKNYYRKKFPFGSKIRYALINYWSILLVMTISFTFLDMLWGSVFLATSYFRVLPK